MLNMLASTTNWQAYAEQVLEIIGTEFLLRNTPHTEQEKHGLERGHGAWELEFKRI